MLAKYLSTILIIAASITFATAFYYDLAHYYVLWLLGASFLSMETVMYIRLQRFIGQKNTFTVKSNAWMMDILTLIPAFFFVSLEVLNVWNVTGIIFLAITAVLKVMIGKYTYYELVADGIRNLNKNTVSLKIRDITGIRVTEDEIAVDTTKYINELQIPRDALKEPHFDYVLKNLLAWGKDLGIDFKKGV